MISKHTIHALALAAIRSAAGAEHAGAVLWELAGELQPAVVYLRHQRRCQRRCRSTTAWWILKPAPPNSCRSLAERWEVSDDGKRSNTTFHLRKGVGETAKCSNRRAILTPLTIIFSVYAPEGSGYPCHNVSSRQLSL